MKLDENHNFFTIFCLIYLIPSFKLNYECILRSRLYEPLMSASVKTNYLKMVKHLEIQQICELQNKLKREQVELHLDPQSESQELNLYDLNHNI